MRLGHGDNVFDIVRHVAALMVLVSHHYALSRVAVPSFLGIFSYGAFAVLIFFAISGYLVTRSFWFGSSFWSYFERRIQRLFPGLIVCSAIMVFGLCAFLGVRPPLDYIFSEGAYNSFMSSVWMEGMGGDVNKFTHDYKYPNALNGSLWTLRYEFFSYIIVPVALIVFRRSILGLLILLAFAVGVQLLYASGSPVILSLFRFTLLLLAFVTGGLLFFMEKYWRALWVRYGLALFFALIVVFAPRGLYMQPFFYIALSYLTVFVGLEFSDRLISGRFDYSYGIYIYAFPVQQLVINILHVSFWLGMFISVGVTLVLAIFSWYLVEKPFLKSRRYASASSKVQVSSVGIVREI